jgi:hypothetical protein
MTGLWCLTSKSVQFRMAMMQGSGFARIQEEPSS